jgi:hypothetical protein
LILLERDEITLNEDLIAKEIESKRHTIAALSEIDEVWFVDTVHREAWEYVRFSMRNNGRAVKFLAFSKGRLHRRYGT